MPFEILTLTPATLTSFTGRTETHGKDKVAAVSCRLRFRGPNTLLDKLSPSIRHTLYMAAEGQEDLPGVEPPTPLLRCKDIKTWSPENCYEGWTVTIEHGIDDSSAIVMGACKVDEFDQVNSYFGLLRQSQASHHLLARLANAARDRGFTVNASFTKAFRKAATPGDL